MSRIIKKELDPSPKSQLLLIAKSEELLKLKVDPAHKVSSITEKDILGEVFTYCLVSRVVMQTLLTARDTS